MQERIGRSVKYIKNGVPSNVEDLEKNGRRSVWCRLKLVAYQSKLWPIRRVALSMGSSIGSMSGDLTVANSSPHSDLVLGGDVRLDKGGLPRDVVAACQPRGPEAQDMDAVGARLDTAAGACAST